jgi:NAD(P)-dependent dehydrogenase (short-subunit alcohol dehydrogenase family)
MTDTLWEDEQRKGVISQIHPFRGLGRPEDIARAVVFLASEDNSWMTGSMMTVDGGFTCQ